MMHTAILAVLGTLVPSSAAAVAAPGDPPEGKTFELEEGEARRSKGLGLSVRRGGRVDASEQRPAGLRGVPEFVVEKPLFGAFPLGAPNAPDVRGRSLYFALDMRKPDGRRYDRLYLDLDLDGDLSDEESRRTSKEFEITFDLGDGLGERTLELKPRVHGLRDRTTTVTLYHTRVRHGTVEIGGKEFEVALGEGEHLAGRFDQPSCPLALDPGPEFPGEDRLGAGRLFGGIYYVFSASPDGSRLTVTPYDGEWGVFRVGAGNREVKEVEFSGSLLGDFDAPLGELRELEEGWGSPEPTKECRLPVGDYRPVYLTARFDALSVSLSSVPSSATDSKDAEVEPIAIREDRPYVLDFTGAPTITFTTPEPDARIGRGDTLRVEALLTVPELGVMIRDIGRLREGKEPGSWKRHESLHPKITVIDSKGEIRAKGTMPFG